MNCLVDGCTGRPALTWPTLCRRHKAVRAAYRRQVEHCGDPYCWRRPDEWGWCPKHGEVDDRWTVDHAPPRSHARQKARRTRRRPGSASRSPGADTLRQLYWDQGLTLQQIGEQYGVTRQTVSLWMRAADVPTRP